MQIVSLVIAGWFAYFKQIVFICIRNTLFFICTEKSNFNFKVFIDNCLCSPFYFPHVEQS